MLFHYWLLLLSFPPFLLPLPLAFLLVKLLFPCGPCSPKSWFERAWIGLLHAFAFLSSWLFPVLKLLFPWFPDLLKGLFESVSCVPCPRPPLGDRDWTACLGRSTSWRSCATSVLWTAADAEGVWARSELEFAMVNSCTQCSLLSRDTLTTKLTETSIPSEHTAILVPAMFRSRRKFFSERSSSKIFGNVLSVKSAKI